jgi:hypothetical protein
MIGASDQARQALYTAAGRKSIIVKPVLDG